MLKHNDARHAGDQECAERARPTIPEKPEKRRQAEAEQDGNGLHRPMLPDDLVSEMSGALSEGGTGFILNRSQPLWA
ncbi:MAG TPA: hypothetical protein VGW57_07055 [Chthoniobacterales bacterium]|nr:hypothetical protein [Chthoniobacterales bacterium]